MISLPNSAASLTFLDLVYAEFLRQRALKTHESPAPVNAELSDKEIPLAQYHAERASVNAR